MIYGIDYDPRHSRLFYGDRDSAAIWTVSVSGVSSVQDDRSLVVANASVWDLTYDWLNAYLYWTEDRSVANWLGLQVLAYSTMSSTYL